LGWGGGWGWPYYWPYYWPYDYGNGLYGVSGTADDAALPATYLNSGVAQRPATTQVLSDVPTTRPVSGGLRYDGGPASSVPNPNANQGGGATTVPATGLPISLKKAQPPSPYTFKAYGEK
jgi:hypothetical protein